MDVRDDSRRAEPEEVRVRPAQPVDRDAVLAFCAHTWGDEDGDGDGNGNGDYIAEVWDDWLGDERGVLLVATLGERPVGIAHVRLMSTEEAWLEGIRVDPTHRRQGIGRVLTSRALVAARERGAVVARLMTTWDNSASQRLFAAFGFTRVAEVVYYEAPAAAGPVPRLAAPGAEAFERLWGWLEHSNLAPFNGGLEFVGWAARALVEPRLRAYLAAGEVQTLEEWDTIQALAIVRARPAAGTEPGQLEVRYLDGMADGIGRLALTLRTVAAERGVAIVQLWLPDLLILRDAMDGAGFVSQGDGAMWAYSRDL